MNRETRAEGKRKEGQKEKEGKSGRRICSSRTSRVRAGKRGWNDERRKVCVLRKRSKEEDRGDPAKGRKERRGKGTERRVYAIRSPPEVPSCPVPSFRCPRVCHAVRLNAKGLRSGSGVTERAGKGKIRRQPVAKRKIDPHISRRPATTTTAPAAAAAAATTVGHTRKTKDSLCRRAA